MAKDNNPPVRDPNNPPGAGDNLTPAEKQEALYWSLKRAMVDIEDEKEKLNTVLKALNKRLTASRLAFAQGTGILLADYDAIQRVAKLQKAERSTSVRNYNYMAELEGLQPGGQMSMVAAMMEANERTPEPVRDAFDWEFEGRQAYQRNLECKPSDKVPPEHHQNWIKGWQGMQEKTAWAMASKAVIDRDTAKDGSQTKPPTAAAGESCATCGGDGSRLAPEVMECPICGTEYEPPGAEAKTDDPLLH
jgi:hypothetical protein